MAPLAALCLFLAVVRAAVAQPRSLRGLAPNATAAALPGSDVEPNNASIANSSDASVAVLDVAIMSTTEDIEGVNSTAEPALLGGANWASPGEYGSGGCALYRMCNGRTACVINGYLVVPGEPRRGMEEISGGTAGRWDFLWSVARGQCGSEGCVLITNPVGHRTQEQMHIHFRHYNGGGSALKRRLEGALCESGGWRPFGMCAGGKARLFDGMPGVFSAVAGAYGGGSLANVGITVWFTSACGGGQKVMVLATERCSIEHSISAR